MDTQSSKKRFIRRNRIATTKSKLAPNAIRMTKETIEPGEEETVTSDVLAAWLGSGA